MGVLRTASAFSSDIFHQATETRSRSCVDTTSLQKAQWVISNILKEPEPKASTIWINECLLLSKQKQSKTCLSMEMLHLKSAHLLETSWNQINLGVFLSPPKEPQKLSQLQTAKPNGSGCRLKMHLLGMVGPPYDLVYFKGKGRLGVNTTCDSFDFAQLCPTDTASDSTCSSKNCQNSVKVTSTVASPCFKRLEKNLHGLLFNPIGFPAAPMLQLSVSEASKQQF